jgi:hypothetical protein
MRPNDRAELERLRADGHMITRQRHRFRIESELASVRNTQLYRTLLHEIGHWVDWLEKVIRPALHELGFESEERLKEAYFRRPAQERESFAHKYADRTRGCLTETGAIPFAREPSGFHVLVTHC